MAKRNRGLWPILLLPLVCGCSALRSSGGGGQGVSFDGSRRVNAADVAVPAGYSITAVATELDCPTGVCVDDGGNVCVTETNVGGNSHASTLSLIKTDGSRSVIASGFQGPWDGVTFYHGDFYVSEAGYNSGGPVGNLKAESAIVTRSPAPHETSIPYGRILKISRDGKITPLVSNLPSLGEFHVNGPVVGGDGYVYFGEGTATNSGIVGRDDEQMGWLDFNRRFHDLPGADIKLAGVNVQTGDAQDAAGIKITGAFSPYGEPTAPGQAIPVQIPCGGAVMRVALAGGLPELVAWGFRNPVGVAFDSQGQLYATDQSYEDRGSRPVSGCGDMLWPVKSGLWYGWPDYYGSRPLNSSRQFAVIGKAPPRLLLAEAPNTPTIPAAVFGMHAAAAGLDFCRNGDFGYVDEAFVAEFGDLAPFSGELRAPVGFDVLRVDPESGVSQVFAANRSDSTGPASKVGGGGLERPIAVRFDPSGNVLYVVDYGVVTVGDRPSLHARTGVLWKITREAQ